MKRNLFFLFIFFNTFSFGQKLTINDLMVYCSKKNWVDVDNILVAKGWTYYESKVGDSFNYNTITWAFKKSQDSDKARAWVHLYTYEGYPSRIFYNFFNKESFSFIQNSISSSGFILNDSKIDDALVSKFYSNSQYNLTISIEKSKSKYWDDASYNTYSVVVVKKASVYDENNGVKTINYPNGSLLMEYSLKNGKKEGAFKVYYDDGTLKKSGFFSNNLENGIFKEFDEDGNIEIEYNMVKGIMDGAFKTFYSDGSIKRTGVIKNGKQNGKQIEYYPNGTIQSNYIMKDDSLDGPFFNYSEYGVLNLSTNYKNGSLHGAFILFDENGNKTIEISFDNGLKNGMSTTYENGVLISKTNYVNDLRHGPFYSIECFNDNSYCITEKGNYVNDTIDGYYETAIVKNNQEIVLDFYNYSMGVLNGSFQRFSSDTLEIGSYKNGVLDGGYWLHYGYLPFGINDQTFAYIKSNGLKEHGIYRNGFRNGFWEYYHSYSGFGFEKNIALESCGNYYNNEKDGEWYYYSNIPTFINNEDTPLRDTIYKISNYKNGKLNGKSTSFITTEKLAIPCSSLEGDDNSDDTCYMYNFIKEKTIAYYKNDKLDGYYEILDSIGIKVKGFFKNNIKDGEWYERVTLYDSYSSPYYHYNKGSYNNGVKNGLWLELNFYGDTIYSAHFSNNILDGEYIIFNANKLPITKINYKNGKGSSITVFDSSGVKRILLYDNFDIRSEFYFCKRTAFFDDYFESQVFVVATTDEINYILFFDFFESLLKNSKYYGNIFKEGEYLLSRNTLEPLIKGLYSFDLKNETWHYFFYKQGVKKEVLYKNDSIISEKYYTLDNLLFSGELVYFDNINNEKHVIKIKKGLRHGASSYFNLSTNKKIRKEKYRKGILVH